MVMMWSYTWIFKVWTTLDWIIGFLIKIILLQKWNYLLSINDHKLLSL